MTALMGDDPQTRHYETVSEGIEGPKRNASERVKIRAGEVDVLGRNEAICIFGGLVDGGDQEEVPDTEKLRVNYSERVNNG